MRLDETLTRHAARAEARAEPVEQFGELIGALGFLGARPFALRGRERLGDKAGKAHQVDAEAGVDLLLRAAGEPLGEQPCDRARFVQRPARADANAAHVAVDAKKAELQRARALHLALQHPTRSSASRASVAIAAASPADRAREAPLGDEFGRGEARRDRGARSAHQFVEPRDDVGAETGGDRRARAQSEVADALEARAREIGGKIGRDPERGGRHFMEELGERLSVEPRRGDAVRRRSARARRRRAGCRRGPARSAKPSAAKRASTSPTSPASPPNRWATPETSSISPSAPSSATSGV